MSTPCSVAGSGSPPRERGAQLPCLCCRRIEGITPARAGSTSRIRAARCTSWDHPRASGEHGPVLRSVLTGRGSPPRERGARPGPAVSLDGTGITPARAGSTASPGSSCRRRADHPRASGEHRVTRLVVSTTRGSPPRERGAQRVRLHEHSGAGITPARAGSTRRCGRTCRSAWDHPRASGEHASTARSSSSKCGSPPRERGAHPRRPDRRDQGRITPARAGSTSRPGPTPSRRGDHPRASGEHIRSEFDRVTRMGSPPRERGARFLIRHSMRHHSVPDPVGAATDTS